MRDGSCKEANELGGDVGLDDDAWMHFSLSADAVHEQQSHDEAVRCAGHSGHSFHTFEGLSTGL